MSGLIDLILAARILAPLILVGLLALFLYHCLVYRKTQMWKREATKFSHKVVSLKEELRLAKAENQRLNSKLNSSKTRLRRMRKASRRREQRNDKS